MIQSGKSINWEVNMKSFENMKEVVTLYHGSKSGIRGSIAPISRERCDFGKDEI